MNDDDIVRLPPIDERIGSCPECGLSIRESDVVMEENVFNRAVYRCIHCKELVDAKDIIPF